VIPSTLLAGAQVIMDKIRGTEDEKIGVEIVRRAPEGPLRMLAHNAGAEGSTVRRVQEPGDIGCDSR
jgi:chaperonin GroEL